MLDYETQLEHIRRAKSGDKKAQEEIYLNNIPLIKSIISRFKNKGIEYDDLFQIGSIGFMKAINNFDESFGVRFSTYSVPMIIGEIKRYIRDNGAIKISRSVKILASKVNRYIEEYQSSHSEKITIKQLAEKFSVTEDEIVVALDCSKMPVSIYDKYEEDEEGQELIDKIPTGETEENLVDKIQLVSIIEKLSERERKIIILRYFRDKTQSEIAETLGVSQVQVSRLENKIIDKIRSNFN